MQQTKNVTYLLGAGASAKCLPCVNDIPKQLEVLCSIFEVPELSPHREYSKTPLPTLSLWNEIKQQMINDLQTLSNKCKEYATIDTYAKKLYLTCEIDEFNHLLRLLSFYFVFEQIITLPDPRYDTFFANVLNRGELLPENINFISWNYDSQFEIAYKEYIPNEYNAIRHGTKFDAYYHQFQLININGLAAFKDNVSTLRKQILTKIDQHGQDENKREERLYQALLLYYDNVYSVKDSSEINTKLSFAFETEKQPYDNLYKRIDEIIAKTDVLVIIGYTFPFFNRRIDRRILSQLAPYTKIYIQDIYPKRIRQNFNATKEGFDKQIIELEDCEQFYLPPELE